MGKGPNFSDGAKEGYSLTKEGRTIKTVRCHCCNKDIPLDPRDDPDAQGMGALIDELFRPKSSSLEAHIPSRKVRKALNAAFNSERAKYKGKGPR